MRHGLRLFAMRVVPAQQRRPVVPLAKDDRMRVGVGVRPAGAASCGECILGKWGQRAGPEGARAAKGVPTWPRSDSSRCGYVWA